MNSGLRHSPHGDFVLLSVEKFAVWISLKNLYTLKSRFLSRKLIIRSPRLKNAGCRARLTGISVDEKPLISSDGDFFNHKNCEIPSRRIRSAVMHGIALPANIRGAIYKAPGGLRKSILPIVKQSADIPPPGSAAISEITPQTKNLNQH